MGSLLLAAGREPGPEHLDNGVDGPRLPLGGVAQHDADLLLLPEQCLGDDLACVPRSTKHDEHCEPPPHCATPSREVEPSAGGPPRRLFLSSSTVEHPAVNR